MTSQAALMAVRNALMKVREDLMVSQVKLEEARSVLIMPSGSVQKIAVYEKATKNVYLFI